MSSEFDLALGLLWSNPRAGLLDEARLRLDAHIASVAAYEGDIKAFWSPIETSEPQAHARGEAWLPIRSIAPLWLSGMARPALAEGHLEGVLYQIYCRSLDRATRVKALDFYHRDAIHPQALSLCIELLTLRHFPRSYLPEALGVTLAYTSMDIPEDTPEASSRHWALLGLDVALGSGLDPSRIRKGFNLYRTAATHVFSRQEKTPLAPTHRHTFAKIIAEKAHIARGYHAKVRLEDRSLDDWLEQHEKNPEALLLALEKSPLIDRTCPFGSRLIQAMDFGGPMFGVFNADERQATAEWITSPESTSTAKMSPEFKAVRVPRRIGAPHPIRPKIRNSRDLFHHLAAAENSTQVPIEGLQLIRRLLRRTRQLQSLKILPKAFAYHPDRLDQFLKDRHTAALKTPRRRFFSNGLSREAWSWTLTQLSPAVLVDGAWLSGVGTAPGPLQAWHVELLQIHEDELGNGNPRQNHPRIYRQLLESLGIHLPEISDLTFVTDPRIHSSAFTFPSYMMAIGWHYPAFEPECLGLNLAIEMSGLGSGYQQVVESMRQVGIDPLIAELHLSIDNLASGHARRARDAIVLYLGNISRIEGPQGEANAWKRIHRGFLSYKIGLLGIGLQILTRHLISGAIKFSK
ncbi:MAG: hypothetical protein RL333_557 [Pseudomonadota bacterium]